MFNIKDNTPEAINASDLHHPDRTVTHGTWVFALVSGAVFGTQTRRPLEGPDQHYLNGNFSLHDSLLGTWKHYQNFRVPKAVMVQARCMLENCEGVSLVCKVASSPTTVTYHFALEAAAKEGASLSVSLHTSNYEDPAPPKNRFDISTKNH